ncbi:MAG: type 4 pilus major pilin [Alphaproteobacteria bacterium]
MIKIKNLRHSDITGRSMIEMLGVLAIVGVLSVGGIAGYSKAMQRFRVSKTLDHVQMLTLGIRTFFASSPSYEGLDDDLVSGANIAPPDMVLGDGSAGSPYSLKSAFNGTVTVSSSSPYDTFDLTFSNLSDSICAELAMVDFGLTRQGAGMTSTKINSSTAFGYDTGMTDPATLTAATAYSQCNQGEANVLVFSFN